MEKVIKVLVVDDSAYNRKAITAMLESSSAVKVVGTAMDGEDAVKKVITLKPDIITLDLEMPKMDGFTFLRVMMSRFPTPTIVLSSRNEDKNVFKALELGAVDFIAKPTHHISTEIIKIKEELLYKVGMAGEVSIERIKVGKSQDIEKEKAPPKKVSTSMPQGKGMIVAIGASTGGPPAIQTVLSMLPADIQAAVVISQHMPPGFTRTFAERLNKLSPLNVKEAEDGETVLPGSVLLSPGGYHMTFVEKSGSVRTRLLKGEAGDKYVPSVNRMFVSASEIFGEKTIGVVMTGMGDDGKDGTIGIKTRGGKTVAQSEDTSVIFGMPREAISTGMVDRILPLEGIADWIVSMCR